MRAAALVYDLLASRLAGRDVLEIAWNNTAFSAAIADVAASVRCALPWSSARMHADETRFGIVRMQAGMLFAEDASADAVILINPAELSALLLDEALRVLRPGGVIVAAATQPASRAVITDILLPLTEQRQLSCRLSFDAALLCTRIRKPKGESDI